MFNLGQIIGLKVVAIKGFTERKNSKYVKPEFIFFDDRKTYITLEEQDESYHDCSISARIIGTYKNKEMWEKLINNNDLKDATMDI